MPPSKAANSPKLWDLLVMKNFINGEFVENGTCEMLDSVNPSTGQPWARLPDSDNDTVNTAVQAALQAFPKWSSTTAEERSAVMMRVADQLEARKEELARAESMDQGKPLWLARKLDVPRAVHNFRYFATYILHHENKSRMQEQSGALQYTVREAVGVAGLISPWNLPLYLLTFKVAPAMAAGNTVVAKPSELTSATAFLLCEAMKDAGVPPGVFNVVFGTGAQAGGCLVCHPQVPLISFTGGTQTAEIIRKAASPMCKKLSLELGGKNAAVVFADADLDTCVNTCIRSSFLNQGEICLCTSRIYVHREIYHTFLEKFLDKALNLQVGDPSEEANFMGAVVSGAHLNKIQNAVELARREGATIHQPEKALNGSLARHCLEGYFFPPTVITEVADGAGAMQDEIFGPVTCVVPFDNEQEVVARANDVKYGLCATVWTTNVATAFHMSHKLRVGTVWVNCWLVRDLAMPFGGMKESGIGREGGQYSIDFFTEQKTVCVQLGLP
ncbi:hypothetical protein ACOMHN_043727 [Nucella lapillus]